MQIQQFICDFYVCRQIAAGRWWNRRCRKLDFSVGETDDFFKNNTHTQKKGTKFLRSPNKLVSVGLLQTHTKGEHKRTGSRAGPGC